MSKYRTGYSEPVIDEKDYAGVLEALKEKRLSSGKIAEAFERMVADYCGCTYGIATCNGTSALHLALLGLGVGRGDEVIVPDYTFAASVFPILYVDAHPVLVDVDPVTFNMTDDGVKEAIRGHDRVKAIMPTHLAGLVADLDYDLFSGTVHGIPVIEDACEAFGAQYDKWRAGGLGRAGCFSFYPNKPITTGEGGMLVTTDGGVARQARAYRNYGQTVDDERFTHSLVGYHYRMSDLQAALGISQFLRLEKFHNDRLGVAEYYDKYLPKNVKRPVYDPGHAYMFYLITCEDWPQRDRIRRALASAGIETAPPFVPVHRQPFWQRIVVGEGAWRTHDYVYESKVFPVSDEIYLRVLGLPMYAGMDKDLLKLIVDTVREVTW